jgi:hypothetical protein
MAAEIDISRFGLLANRGYDPARDIMVLLDGLRKFQSVRGTVAQMTKGDYKLLDSSMREINKKMEVLTEAIGKINLNMGAIRQAA